MSKCGQEKGRSITSPCEGDQQCRGKDGGCKKWMG